MILQLTGGLPGHLGHMGEQGRLENKCAEMST